MKTEEEKKEAARQRERIRRLDKEMSSCQGNGLPVEWGQRLFGGIVLLILCMPAQFFLEENYVMIFQVLLWTAVIGPTVYLSPFMKFKEQGKFVSYLKKIKYLPIDEKQVKIVRMEYLAGFLKKIVILACAEQLVFGTLICRQNILLSILYAVAVGGVIPLAFGTAMVWMEK